MPESRDRVTRAFDQLVAQEPHSHCLPGRLFLWHNQAPGTGPERHPAEAEADGFTFRSKISRACCHRPR